MIKSGGEWISSIEIENIAVGHPGVACAAVIAMPSERWGERPLLLVEPRPGTPFDADAIRRHLEGRIAKWWMPDAIVEIDRVPLGATGKIDKKALRARFRGDAGCAGRLTHLVRHPGPNPGSRFPCTDGITPRNVPLSQYAVRVERSRDTLRHATRLRSGQTGRARPYRRKRVDPTSSLLAPR